MRCLIVLLILAFSGPAVADGEKAGDFDYYVLALSWTPTWCALEGDARNSPQCDPQRDFGWTMHGLWPQYETGWPAFCRSSERNPSRSQTKAMADIMGTDGLAWYQWKKHGICSGLSSEDYYALARKAYESVNRPEIFRDLEKPVKLPALVVEEAFLHANPGWEDDMLTITCKAGRIQEARLCLSKDLTPITCGRDVVRDCQKNDALFDPIR